MNLAENIVEKRQGRDWGLTAPLDYTTPEFKKVLEDTLEVSQLAKTDAEPWPSRVVELLREYTPWELSDDIPSVMAEFGFSSWREIVDHVEDDECVENFVAVNKWSKRNKIPRRKNRDFIDGGGYGDYGRLEERGRRTIQRCFDQKYYNYYEYNTQRPATQLAELLGCEVECLAHYLHPGHPEDPTGHGAKDGECLDYWSDAYDHSDEQYIKVRTFLSIRTHSRSGGPVHYLNSNLKSWALAGIKEAKEVFIRKDWKG